MRITNIGLHFDNRDLRKKLFNVNIGYHNSFNECFIHFPVITGVKTYHLEDY